MKAAVLHGVEDLRYEESQTPKANPGEVVIHVKATGICGSDIPVSTARPHTIIQLFWGTSFPALSPKLARVSPM